MIKKTFGISSIFTAIFLVSIAFLPIVSALAGTSSESSDVKRVTLILDQKPGILYIPTDGKTVIDLNTTNTIKKSAMANLSGTIDKNNFVVLEGVITLNGEINKVQLSGHATQVFIGWDIPAGAKPIYYKVGNRTITRYEGATNKYAAYVDLRDKEGKYKLHGEFYKDGTGGIVGKVMTNGVECDIGLLGSSISMYENVSATENLSISEEKITEKLNNSSNNNFEPNNGKNSSINNSNGNQSSDNSFAPGFELAGGLVCLYGGWKLRKK